jgi:hypothetical protein
MVIQLDHYASASHIDCVAMTLWAIIRVLHFHIVTFEGGLGHPTMGHLYKRTEHSGRTEALAVRLTSLPFVAAL